MKLPTRLSVLAIALPLFIGCASGDSGPTGPGGGEVTVVWALNSIGQTIRTFEIGEGILPLGLAVDLGGLFDGVSMDVAFPLAVTSESSFGGDRAIVADLESGGTTPVAFPEPQGDPVNPSKPFVLQGASEAIVGGRGTNSIYRFSLDPPGTPAVVLASPTLEDTSRPRPSTRPPPAATRRLSRPSPRRTTPPALGSGSTRRSKMRGRYAWPSAARSHPIR